MRILIIGNGLTGAYCCYLLARLGMEVACIGPGVADGVASEHNPGGINPLHGPGIPGPMAGFALDCLRLHQQYLAQMAAAGHEVPLRRARRLILASDQAEADQLLDTGRLYISTEGFTAEPLSAKQLRELWSGAPITAAAGLMTTGNLALNSNHYRRALLAAAAGHGATLIDGRVERVACRDGRIVPIQSSQGVLQADAYVFCTGPFPVPGVLGPPPVKPLRGDMLHMALPESLCPCDITWREFGLYRIDADMAWLGGTRRDTGFDTGPDPQARHEIMGGLPSMLAFVDETMIKGQVCGLRPVSPDGLPLLGAMPGADNAWLANGAGAKGVLYSAGLARGIARLVKGQSLESEWAVMSPGRFMAERGWAEHG